MVDEDEMRDIERAVEASIQSYHKRVKDNASAILAASLQNEELQCFMNDIKSGDNQLHMNTSLVNKKKRKNNAGNFDIITVDSEESNTEKGRGRNGIVCSDLPRNDEQNMDDFQYAQALDQSLELYEVTKLNDKMYDNAIHQTIERTEERNKGSWDCIRCTFTNEPYQRKCKMCNDDAPSHVLTFDNKKYQNVPFGVEIEIIIPDGKSDGFTLESIAKDLTKIGPEVVRFEGYSHATKKYWKIVTDSSIRENNNNHDLAFELVSPVLLGEDGLVSLRNIMSNIRMIGISTNSSCGFHVHVDASGNNLIELKRISQYFVALENAFDMIVAGSNNVTPSLSGSRRANDNWYCRSNRILFGEQSNQQRWTSISNTQTINDLVTLMNPDRYRKLNLTNIINDHRPSTIEFRQHGGVEDIQIAEAWVRFVLSFCCNASCCENICILDESATPHDELQCLFQLVRCKGLQQFFTLERKLFENYPLSNLWKCKVCYRMFNSSRSLSQHILARRH